MSEPVKIAEDLQEMFETCSHCGGLHYGSPQGKCVYVCGSCGRDIRLGVQNRCTCPILEKKKWPVLECNHAHLIKVLNMNSTTYKCQNCKNLYDVTLGEVAQVEVVFGTSTEKKEDKPE